MACWMESCKMHLACTMWQCSVTFRKHIRKITLAKKTDCTWKMRALPNLLCMKCWLHDIINHHASGTRRHDSCGRSCKVLPVSSRSQTECGPDLGQRRPRYGCRSHERCVREVCPCEHEDVLCCCSAQSQSCASGLHPSWALSTMCASSACRVGSQRRRRPRCARRRLCSTPAMHWLMHRADSAHYFTLAHQSSGSGSGPAGSYAHTAR